MENINLALTLLIAGFVIVFIVLILLIVIITLYGKIIQSVQKSSRNRKERKRQMRQLWIARINAAARMNGLSYSKFMYGLKLADVNMNRKMLAEMAVNDAEGFAELVELAKSKVA